MKPLSASEAVASIESGKLTSEKLVRDCLDRIAERVPDADRAVASSADARPTKAISGHLDDELIAVAAAAVEPADLTDWTWRIQGDDRIRRRGSHPGAGPDGAKIAIDQH